MRRIKYIVIHCTAGYGDVAAIKRFWKESLKWKQVGYHYFIYENGRIEQLAPLNEITNGVKGHNSNSVHIAYQGGVDQGNVRKAKDTRTPEQKKAIVDTINRVLTELEKTQDVSTYLYIKGHRDFSPDKNRNGIIDSWERIKECPSFDAIPEYKSLIKTTILLIAVCLLLGLGSCKSSRQSIATDKEVSDSTTIIKSIVERDTVIVTQADTVSVLLDCPSLYPISNTGTQNAHISTKPLGDKTLVKCTCDTLKILAKLQDSFETKERIRTETVYKTKTVYKDSSLKTKMATAGWIFILLAAAFIIIQIIKIFR